MTFDRQSKGCRIRNRIVFVKKNTPHDVLMGTLNAILIHSLARSPRTRYLQSVGADLLPVRISTVFSVMYRALRGRRCAEVPSPGRPVPVSWRRLRGAVDALGRNIATSPRQLGDDFARCCTADDPPPLLLVRSADAPPKLRVTLWAAGRNSSR